MEKDPILEKYKSEGFGKNAMGWYFNPWIDEYDPNYDPHNDKEYNDELKANKKEHKWHSKLTEEQIMEAIQRDIYEPEGQEYEQFLAELGLKSEDDKNLKESEQPEPEPEQPEPEQPEPTDEMIRKIDKELAKQAERMAKEKYIATPERPISITFDAKKRLYSISITELNGMKTQNREISLDDIIKNADFDEFNKKYENVCDNIKIDPYLTYVISQLKIENADDIISAYANAIKNQLHDSKSLQSLKITYNMDGIYGRQYTPQVSSDIMSYANACKEKNIAKVNKGRITKFLEKHDTIRKAWETVSKIGKKVGLLPQANVKQQYAQIDEKSEDENNDRKIEKKLKAAYEKQLVVQQYSQEAQDVVKKINGCHNIESFNILLEVYGNFEEFNENDRKLINIAFEDTKKRLINTKESTKKQEPVQMKAETTPTQEERTW